jgi:YHS domain-containing protein
MLSLLLATALAVTSPNVLCPVTGRQVTNHALFHHVTVRGRQYYVFDREAAIRLKNCPDCYLAQDGTPLNAMVARLP